MPVAGESFQGTPAETVTSLKEHPELVTVTSFPNAGVDFYVGYDAESETFTNQVVTAGAEANDPDAVIVHETGLTEEEILFHFECLIEKEEMAANPMLAMLHAIMSGELASDPEDYLD